MLTTAIKKQIRSSFEAAKIQISNFSNRSSQNKMIAEISKTLSANTQNQIQFFVLKPPQALAKQWPI